MSTIPNFSAKRFERTPHATYEKVPDIDNRSTAYIVFPANAATADIEDVLWWAKTRQGPEAFVDEGEVYRVYLIYIKTRLIEHITEEIALIGGSYLRNKKD